MDSTEEHKCMVRLVKMALGYSDKAAEPLLSPTKNGNGSTEIENGSTEEAVDEEEIVYENEEYLMEDFLE